MRLDKIIQRVILDKYVVYYNGNIYTNKLRNPKVLTGDVLGIDTPVSETLNRLTKLVEDHQKTLDTLKNSCVVVTMENDLITMSIVLL